MGITYRRYSAWKKAVRRFDSKAYFDGDSSYAQVVSSKVNARWERESGYIIVKE